ncbi:MAG: DUF1131 family protein [Bacteroidota bacterium]
MKTRLVFFTILFLLTWSACNQKQPSGNVDNPEIELPTGQPKVNETREPLPPPPLPPDGVVSISDYGFGAINKDTPFNENSLKEALPEFILKKESLETIRQTYEKYSAYKKNKKVLDIYPDSKNGNVGTVHLFTDEFEGPNGIRVGMTYRQAEGDAMNCFPGMEELSGYALCFNGGNTRVQYIFSHSFEGPDDQLPPPAVLSASGIVKRIIWYAGKN